MGNIKIKGDRQGLAKKFSKDEAIAFVEKFEFIKEKENLSPVTGFIFSRRGFTKEAETYLIESRTAYSSNEHWLDI
ncbi:MAG: hypothetical protein GY940_19535 [bacterium]|nr:hypothetical protein [bacterium]